MYSTLIFILTLLLTAIVLIIQHYQGESVRTSVIIATTYIATVAAGIAFSRNITGWIKDTLGEKAVQCKLGLWLQFILILVGAYGPIYFGMDQYEHESKAQEKTATDINKKLLNQSISVKEEEDKRLCLAAFIQANAIFMRYESVLTKIAEPSALENPLKAALTLSGTLYQKCPQEFFTNTEPVEGLDAWYARYSCDSPLNTQIEEACRELIVDSPIGTPTPAGDQQK